MDRPRLKENALRNRRLIVRLSDDERAAIRAKAQKSGLRLSEYVRRIAMNGEVVVRQQSAYGTYLTSQLKKIGVNLNQLMPIAHLDGEIPPEMASVWRKLEQLLDRILRTT